MRRCSWLLVLLAGCWVSSADVDDVLLGEADTDTDTDTDTDVDIFISSVQPSFGTEAGGSLLLIEASPLDAEAQVWFGDQEATVNWVNSAQISVTTPEGTPGTADVRVESGDGSGLLEDGFTYWPDATGRAGVLGTHSWYDKVGTYWSDPGDYGETWVNFIEPAEVEALDFYGPELDACESDFLFDWGLVSDRDIGAGRIELQGATGSKLVLLQNTGLGSWYEDTDLASWDWKADESWKLLPVDGDLPYFEVPGFIVTPPEFTLTSPVLDGSTPPYVSPELELTWSTEDSGDFMAAILVRYEGESIAETVRCAMVDDGAFTVPYYAWDGDWSYLDQLSIYVGRVQVSTAYLPHDHSEVEVAGVYWVVGAAWQLY